MFVCIDCWLAWVVVVYDVVCWCVAFGLICLVFLLALFVVLFGLSLCLFCLMLVFLCGLCCLFRCLIYGVIVRVYLVCCLELACWLNLMFNSIVLHHDFVIGYY